MAECSYTYKTPEGEEKEFKDLEALHKYLLSDKVSKDAITSQLKSESHATAKSEGPLEEGHQQAGVEEHTRTGTPRNEEKEPQTSGGDRDQDGKGREQKEEKVKPEEAWAGGIWQDKLKEIKAVKKLFEKETGTKWSDIQQGALEEIAERYPDRSLYEGTKARVEELAAMYDNGVRYNPTDYDIAVMQEFSRATAINIAREKPRLGSSDDAVRSAAIAATDGYENDMTNLGKASGKAQAGRAFGLRQGETRMSSDYGLQIRRKDMMKAQGGSRLSPEQEARVKALWEQEKANMEAQNEARDRKMQEEFDAKIEDLRKEIGDKLKKQEDKGKTPREKSLSQKGKDVADKIRKFKMDPSSTRMDFTLGGYNLAVEGVAQLVEAGSSIAEAIDTLIKDKQIGFKSGQDRRMFENSLLDSLNRAETREKALSNIEKISGGEYDQISQKMVSGNHIRDFVNSYLGKGAPEDILGDALKDLQEVLPNTDKQQLIDAYLKENDYRQPTKDDLKKGVREERIKLQRIAKKESDPTLEQQEKNELDRQKKNVIKNQKELQRKLDEGEFEEREHRPKVKADAELIILNRLASEIERQYRKNEDDLKEKNKGWGYRVGEALKGLYVTGLIMSPHTWLRVLASTVIRPASEAASKVTFGRMFSKIFPNFASAAKGGGESSSIASMRLMGQAYFSQMGPKRIEALGKKLDENYAKAQRKLADYKVSGGSDAERLKKLQGDADTAYGAAAANVIYQFIGGSSLKDALDSLKHRTNQIEAQFHEFDYEKWEKKGGPNRLLKNIAYVTNFVGRSHAALKTFSGRAFFASGFMARVEHAIENGVDLNNPDRLLEIAHESMNDWDMGKLQQKNFVSNMWNGMVDYVENGKQGDPTGKWANLKKTAGILLRSDVAITRVPNNVYVEALDYSIGAFRSLVMAKKAYNEAYKKTLNDYEGTVADPEFKERLAEAIRSMDEDKAASIARAFRRGGIGVGLYALTALFLGVKFGTFPHFGQKKKKAEEDLGDDELNPGQIMFGNDKLGTETSNMINETPAFFPMLMGSGMRYMYQSSIDAGKSESDAALKAFLTHLQIMQEKSPQLKLFNPLAISQSAQSAAKKDYTDISGAADATWGLFYPDNSNQ